MHYSCITLQLQKGQRMKWGSRYIFAQLRAGVHNVTVLYITELIDYWKTCYRGCNSQLRWWLNNAKPMTLELAYYFPFYRPNTNQKYTRHQKCTSGPLVQYESVIEQTHFDEKVTCISSNIIITSKRKHMKIYPYIKWGHNFQLILLHRCEITGILLSTVPYLRHPKSTPIRVEKAEGNS